MFGFTGISVSAVFKVNICHARMFLSGIQKLANSGPPIKTFGGDKFYYVILMLIGLSTLSYSDSTFFHSKDIFREESDSASPQEVNQANEQKIMLFIDPQCSWCKKSLVGLSAFKKRNPYWKFQVYVMAGTQEFIDFFHQQAMSLPSDLDYTLDFHNQLADQYEVNQTPTYIINTQGNIKKVEGYVDLAHFNLDDD